MKVCRKAHFFYLHLRELCVKIKTEIKEARYGTE